MSDNLHREEGLFPGIMAGALTSLPLFYGVQDFVHYLYPVPGFSTIIATIASIVWTAGLAFIGMHLALAFYGENNE